MVADHVVPSCISGEYLIRPSLVVNERLIRPTPGILVKYQWLEMLFLYNS